MNNKMTLDDMVWSKRHWESTAAGGCWIIPMACMVMQKTNRGFSLMSVMPYTEQMQRAAENGVDVPKTAAELLKHQRQTFDFIAERFVAAGLDFDDPKDLLERKNKNEGTN